MAVIRSEIVGEAKTVLVVRLPTTVVDETAGPLRDEVTRRLPNSEGAGLVLDCTQVELINSIGITCLLQLQDHCRRLGARMILAAVPSAIQVFLTQLKLDRRFERAAGVDEAVAAIDLGRA